MSCSLNVVSHFWSRENTSMSNSSRDSRVRMLREFLGMLHVDFGSLMWSFFNFMVFWKVKGAA